MGTVRQIRLEKCGIWADPVLLMSLFYLRAAALVDASKVRLQSL
jgi:hypothetical protein